MYLFFFINGSYQNNKNCLITNSWTFGNTSLMYRVCFFFEKQFVLSCFYFITARKRSLQRLCFYMYLSVQRGCLDPDPGGRLGDWPGGCLGPHPGGGCPGPHPGGGLSRPTPGGCPGPHWEEGCPGPGPGGIFQHALRQTPPQQTAITMGGTHPTGMHSYFKYNQYCLVTCQGTLQARFTCQVL